MTEHTYHFWVDQGQQRLDSGLGNPNSFSAEQTAELDQAGFCFLNAQDVHWQAYLSHQRFQLHAQAGQVEPAYRFAHQSLQQYQAAFDPKGQTLFLIHWAHFLSAQGRDHKALSSLRAAVVLAKEKAPDRLGLALSSLGEEYLAQGNYGEAIHQFDLCLATGGLDEASLSWCFKSLGDAFSGLYRLVPAEGFYRKALKKSLDIGYDDLASHCRELLLKLEETLQTDFSFSELGLKSKSALQSLKPTNPTLF